MRKFFMLVLALLAMGTACAPAQEKSKTMAKLLYQGHGSCRIISAKGMVIYVDPYAGGGYGLPADFVFVTHEHYDHNAVDKVTKDSGCRIYRAKNFISGGRYGEARFNGIKVQAVPAYNKNHDASECVGYVITLENGITVYCAGATSYTDYMEETLSKMHIDYALLPCDGVMNMDAAEASRCAEVIGARHSIPVHTRQGVLFDPKVAAAFTAAGALILQPGQEIDLVK